MWVRVPLSAPISKNEEHNKYYIDVENINLYKDINKIKKLMKNNIKSGYLVRNKSNKK